MRKDRASKTAEAVAAVRAAHRRYESPVVFDDPYALALTSPGWRRIVGSRLLHELVLRRLLRATRPVGAQVLMRARYAEEELERALARGVRQYVIVGAGLDSFALRRGDLAGRLRLFEVDHPATQAAKRARLAALGATPKVELEWVAADFERTTLGDALGSSSFDRAAPAFFSWLGTTHYLSPEAVIATLRSIAEVAAPASRIVFDYTVRAGDLSDEDRREYEATSRFVARRGEPFRSSFEPAALAATVGALGYGLIEDLDATEQRRRYFAGRADGLRPTALARIAQYEVAPRAAGRPG